MSFHSRVFSGIDAIMKYYEGVADTNLADDFYEEIRQFVISASRTSRGFQHSGERIQAGR